MPYLRRTLGVIFQDFRLIGNKTVYENVAFAMRVIGRLQRRCASACRMCSSWSVWKRRATASRTSCPAASSSAWPSRALVNNPSVIIADEPTGNLDPARSLEIMMLLEQINALGTTVLVVTHERELVNRFTKRVIASTRAASSATAWAATRCKACGTILNFSSGKARGTCSPTGSCPLPPSASPWRVC